MNDDNWRTELESLALELSGLYDFQARAFGLLDRMAKRPPPTRRTMLRAWLDLLTEEPTVRGCGFVRGGGPWPLLEIEVASEEDAIIERLVQSEFGERVSKRMAAAAQLTAEVPPAFLPDGCKGGQVFLQPLLPRALRTGLLVISKPGVAPQLDYVVQATAVLASCAMSVYLQRELAEQQIAAQICHMSSSSILVAQFRLDAAGKALRDGGPAAQDVQKALDALADAQTGFDRARLLGVPLRHPRRTIPLGPLLVKVGAELNKMTGREVVSENRLGQYRRRQLSIAGGEERLRFALRETALATWLFGEMEPVQLAVRGATKTACVTVRGGRIEFPVAANGSDLMDLLSDPSECMFTLVDKPAVRGIGFHLPRKLVEEMGGRMSAELERSSRRLVVHLTLPRACRPKPPSAEKKEPCLNDS